MSNDFTPAHPFAEIFPLHIEGQSFFDFADDIKANGLREKIMMYKKMVLDGRRRERGCRRAGIAPEYEEFKGTEADALAYVISRNLHRRHLGEGERALIAAKIVTARQGSPGIGKNKETSQNATFTDKPVTAKEAAAMTGSTEAKVDRAKKVIKNGTPALQAAVADETISVSDAAKVSSEPPNVQDNAVEMVKAGKLQPPRPP